MYTAFTPSILMTKLRDAIMTTSWETPSTQVLICVYQFVYTAIIMALYLTYLTVTLCFNDIDQAEGETTLISEYTVCPTLQVVCNCQVFSIY